MATSKRKTNLNSDSSDDSDSDLSDSEFQNLAKKRKKSPPQVDLSCLFSVLSFQESILKNSAAFAKDGLRTLVRRNKMK
jgi:hypothetical protein